MGNVYAKYFGKLQSRILIIGLDSAGKTTILYKMKLGEVVTTIPTIGFNVETVEILNINLTIWDIGSRCKMRPLWRHYYQDCQGMVFVVDSNDRERLDEARDEFIRITKEDELRDATIMVLANKQDLESAMSAEDIAKAFKLESLHHQVGVFGVCATDGTGLQDAFHWLTENLRIKARTKKTQNTSSTENTLKPSGFSFISSWIKTFMQRS